MILEKTTIILNFRPIYRKLILFITDLVLLHFSFHITSLFFGNLLIPNFEKYFFYVTLLTLLAFPIYIFTGQYKSLARYVTNYSIYRMIIRNTLLIFLTSFFSKLKK